MQSISIRKHHLFKTFASTGPLALAAGRFYLTRLSSLVSRITVPSPGTTTLTSDE